MLAPSAVQSPGTNKQLVRMWRLYDFMCHLAFSLKTNPIETRSIDDFIAALTQRNYRHSSLSGSETWV